jgi:hypothetical protein
MRRKHLVIIAIVAMGLALFLPLNPVPKASTLNGHDLLKLQIKVTAIRGESIDPLRGMETTCG